MKENSWWVKTSFSLYLPSCAHLFMSLLAAWAEYIMHLSSLSMLMPSSTRPPPLALTSTLYISIPLIYIHLCILLHSKPLLPLSLCLLVCVCVSSLCWSVWIGPQNDFCTYVCVCVKGRRRQQEQQEYVFDIPLASTSTSSHLLCLLGSHLSYTLTHTAAECFHWNASQLAALIKHRRERDGKRKTLRKKISWMQTTMLDTVIK